MSDHVRLKLQDLNMNEPWENDPHRPELSAWAQEAEDDEPAYVVLMVDDLWGQPKRFVNLTPEEARRLARILGGLADTLSERPTRIADAIPSVGLRPLS